MDREPPRRRVRADTKLAKDIVEHKSDAQFDFEKACRLLDTGRNTQAARIFDRLARAGDDAAQVNLGYCFDTGKGVSKSTSRALYWYKRASRRGNVAATHNIGTIYRDKCDRANARRWFVNAIGKGNFGSAIELAKMYLAQRQTKQGERSLVLALSHTDSLSDAEIEQAQRLLHVVRSK